MYGGNEGGETNCSGNENAGSQTYKATISPRKWLNIIWIKFSHRKMKISVKNKKYSELR